eukprot:g308.t1
MMTVIMNYILALTIYPAILSSCVDAFMQAASRQGKAKGAASDGGPTLAMVRAVLNSHALRALLLIVNLAFLAVTCYGLTTVERGLESTDVLNSDSPFYKYVKTNIDDYPVVSQISMLYNFGCDNKGDNNDADFFDSDWACGGDEGGGQKMLLDINDPRTLQEIR